MTSSGTWNWGLSNSDVLIEALSRCAIKPTEITRYYAAEGMRSMNLELQVWGTRGVNLWAVQEGVVIDLAAPTGTPPAQVGVAAYTLPANLLQILNVRYNQPYQASPPANPALTIDRIMLPIGREDYAAYPNKLQPGQPTVYWFQRLEPPVLTIWQPDATGAPNTITYDALIRIQDSLPINGQTPQVPARFLDALCGKVAARCFAKFWPDLVAQRRMTEQAALMRLEALKGDAEEAWQTAALDDQEMAPLILQADLAPYFR